ncbi:hypothetical protein BOX15_Mlig024700g1, partial [Macrostomum lignano]
RTKMDAKQETISVVVRLRPLIERELNSCCKEEWLAEDSTVRTADGTKRFCFDGVYGKSHQTQALYTQAVKPIVTSCMEGVSGTVFAYGQTSSGKTHTMYGSVQDPGVIVLALRDIFALQEMATEREFLVSISFLEIYNERVIDLLSNDPDKKVSVIIERTKSTLRNVKEEIVTSVDEVLNLLSKGEAQRHIGETNMNERSSRSHTILRLAIESRCREEDGVIWNSVLNLVDLAGSERVSESGASGTTLKEACNINSSLSSLCLVIRQLSENSSYISFRDSKLTSILMSSLGGNSRTLIVCNITPAVYDQSQRTLNFASIAKTVKNKPVVNESVSDEAYRKRLEKQMESLKEQLLKMTCQKDRVEAENERLVRQMETSRVADENPRFGQLAEEQLSERQRVLHQMETLSRYCGASGIDDGDSSTGDVPAMLLRRRTWAPNSRRQLPDSGALRRCLLGAIGEEPPPPPPPPPPAPSLPSLSTASSQQQQQQIFPPVGADSFDDNFVSQKLTESFFRRLECSQMEASSFSIDGVTATVNRDSQTESESWQQPQQQQQQQEQQVLLLSRVAELEQQLQSACGESQRLAAQLELEQRNTSRLAEQVAKLEHENASLCGRISRMEEEEFIGLELQAAEAAAAALESSQREDIGGSDIFGRPTVLSPRADAESLATPVVAVQADAVSDSAADEARQLARRVVDLERQLVASTQTEAAADLAEAPLVLADAQVQTEIPRDSPWEASLEKAESRANEAAQYASELEQRLIAAEARAVEAELVAAEAAQGQSQLLLAARHWTCRYSVSKLMNQALEIRSSRLATRNRVSSKLNCAPRKRKHWSLKSGSAPRKQRRATRRRKRALKKRKRSFWKSGAAPRKQRSAPLKPRIAYWNRRLALWKRKLA